MMPYSIHIEMRELDDCKTGKNRELAEDLHRYSLFDCSRFLTLQESSGIRGRWFVCMVIVRE